jgi:hypothetical protein
VNTPELVEVVLNKTKAKPFAFNLQHSVKQEFNDLRRGLAIEVIALLMVRLLKIVGLSITFRTRL